MYVWRVVDAGGEVLVIGMAVVLRMMVSSDCELKWTEYVNELKWNAFILWKANWDRHITMFSNERTNVQCQRE